ncbi:hypothetical protein HanIR_Chr16g0800781 [Helianthus annuus]|nr:hypothetical protein HanIR_Chr16g0800781 [Helianthus annuus]
MIGQKNLTSRLIWNAPSKILKKKAPGALEGHYGAFFYFEKTPKNHTTIGLKACSNKQIHAWMHSYMS